MLLLFKLLIAHALTDYVLQSDSMVAYKNRHNPVHGGVSWLHWMTAHSLVNAGGVWVATGNPWIAAAEFVLHWIIDFAKCEGWIDGNTDQGLHVAYKILYLFA